jgi:GTP-binding protein
LRPVSENDPALTDGKPQIAFIGRSNVGKSSIINAVTGVKNLAKSSSLPGRTQEINFFLINNNIYFVDLPGYGFAKGSFAKREGIKDMILGYFMRTDIKQHTVVLIVDAKVGPTIDDLDMLELFESLGKDIVVVANKIDKLNQSEQKKSIAHIEKKIGPHTIIPFSVLKKIGIGTLTDIVMQK